MRRGQVEMKETLNRINSNQENIVQLLLHMTHGGNDPRSYVNKESSGSMGGTRYYQEQDPHYHAEGQSLGGGTSRGPTHSRENPRPYMPTFLDGQPQGNHFNESKYHFEEYSREYEALSAGFRRHVTLDQYCGIKFRGQPINYHRNNNVLERREGKMEIPYFDGSPKVSVQTWV
jgi:hypothetical protein